MNSKPEQLLSEQSTAHTPGPWWIHREFSTLYIEGKARDERVVQEVAAIGPKEGGSEQQSADAQLIAAAPDLLASLVEILGYRGGADNALDDEYVIGRAQDAVMKATQP